jgi:RNA-binding protein YlmH
VVRTGFVDANEVDRRLLTAEGVRFAVHGGFTDPSRVVYTLYPEHIPSVDDPVRVVQFDGDFPLNFDVNDLLVALQLPDELRGDARENHGAFLIATTNKGLKQLESLTSLKAMGREIEVDTQVVEPGSLERSQKTRAVVVPSMRVDVVGAKGFGVSRAYFQQGIEGKKVRVNGQIATSSTAIREGDTLIAEGLGRIEFKRVLNETRRGNFKLELEVHK